MTTFTLKIIAMLTMLIDHFAAYLSLSGSVLLSDETLNLMRAIGRMSLPIFAYFIVVGYSKTSNLKKYIGRIHLFALISQIPFILAFHPINYYGNNLLKLKNFSYNINFIIFIIVIIASYYVFICDKKWHNSLIWVAIAYLITPFFLSYEGRVLLAAENLNIFYEFGIALILISMIERIQFLKDNSIILLIINLIFIVSNYYYVGNLANYEFFGILLVLVLRMLKTSKIAQIIAVIMWGIIMYQSSIINILFVAISAGLIYLYNGDKGKPMKYLFYVFYPLHLLIFGIINFIL